MTDVELRQDASAEYVKGWNDGIAARKELDDLSAIDPVALVQAEIEKLRGALRDIQIEAERERGNWTHLKQVIARKARAALGETK
jgi:hypothetical protein